VFAALSGLRQGELFALRDVNVDGDTASVLVEEGAYRVGPRRLRRGTVAGVCICLGSLVRRFASSCSLESRIEVDSSSRRRAA
jgi:hypothetical protein